MATKKKKTTPAASFKKYSKEVLALARAFAKARHEKVRKPKARKPAKRKTAKRHASHDPSWYGESRRHATAAKKGHRKAAKKHHASKRHAHRTHHRHDPMLLAGAGAMMAPMALGDPSHYAPHHPHHAHHAHHGHHAHHAPKHHGGVKKGSAAAKAWGRKMAALRKHSGK